ncbi:MAG: hypothetical protein RLZZ518_961 [Actinomycetota bacterium]|jgi:hypothetical protein
MKLFRRILLVLSVASAIVGILRVGGSSKAKVTTKQGGWRTYTPTRGSSPTNNYTSAK